MGWESVIMMGTLETSSAYGKMLNAVPRNVQTPAYLLKLSGSMPKQSMPRGCLHSSLGYATNFSNLQLPKGQHQTSSPQAV